jgi:hypothetical protein
MTPQFLAILSVVIAAVLVGATAAHRSDVRRRAIAARDLLLERIRHGNGPQELLLIGQPYRDQVSKELIAADRFSEARHTAFAIRDRLIAQVWRGRPWSLGFSIVIAVMAAGWAILFPLQRSMDMAILNALGYPHPTLYGTVIAVTFTIIGIVITGILDVHELLPERVRLTSNFAKFTTALILAALSVLFLAFLTSLATYRSTNRFGPEVSNDTKILQQLKVTGGGAPTAARQVEIDVASTNLADAERRLANGRKLDRVLIIAVLPVEMAISASPILATELAAVGVAGVVGARNGRRERRSRARASTIRHQARNKAEAILAAAGVPLATIRHISSELLSFYGWDLGDLTQDHIVPRRELAPPPAAQDPGSSEPAAAEARTIDVAPGSVVVDHSTNPWAEL